MSRLQRRRAAGFTLIELLVVISILAVLATAGVIALADQTPRAQRVGSAYNSSVVAETVGLAVALGEAPDELDTLVMGSNLADIGAVRHPTIDAGIVGAATALTSADVAALNAAGVANVIATDANTTDGRSFDAPNGFIAVAVAANDRLLVCTDGPFLSARFPGVPNAATHRVVLLGAGSRSTLMDTGASVSMSDVSDPAAADGAYPRYVLAYATQLSGTALPTARLLGVLSSRGTVISADVQ